MIFTPASRAISATARTSFPASPRPPYRDPQWCGPGPDPGPGVHIGALSDFFRPVIQGRPEFLRFLHKTNGFHGSSPFKAWPLTAFFLLLHRHLHPHFHIGFQLLQVSVFQPDASFRGPGADGSRIVGTVDADAVPLALLRFRVSRLMNQGP